MKMGFPTLLEINDAAVREASRSLAVDRGMARVSAMEGGPGRAPPPPKPAPVYVAPAAPPALAAPPKGWDAHRSTSMAAIDARVGRKPR